MKVLIITYYWVPSGGSGVQRWLKFVKYLQDFGIEPVVFTVDNPAYAIVDNSLQADVPKNIEIIRNKIWEPNNFLSLFGKKKTKTSAGFLDSNPGFLGKIKQYIRANYFIPDARKFWVKSSVKKIEAYLLKNKVDVVITTGPPHSLHLIGLALKKKIGVKWVADFRDPWTEIDYFHQLPLTKKAIKKHKNLEVEVLKNADEVLVVGSSMKASFSKFSKNVHVITNGFDSNVASTTKPMLDTKFTITHIGLMNADRNPKILWKVIAEICKENKEFKNDYEVKLIGKIADEVKESIEKSKLTNINELGYLPHSEVKIQQQKTQVLLLAVNKVPSAKMIITGKIFEYLQAKRPILAIGPKDGDLAAIINQTNSGVVVDFNDAKALKKIIINWYNNYKKNELNIASSNIEQYHRKNLTAKLAEILQGVKNS